MRAIRSVPAGPWAVWRIALTFSELTDRPHDDARRGDIVVCIHATADRDSVAASLQTVRAHTDAARRVLVAGGDPGPATVADLNGALAAVAPADVAVLAGGSAVTAGWLDGLRAAADGDPRVAAVSALTSPVDDSHAGLDAQAAKVSEASLRLRPDAPLPSTGCILICRAGLELVGPLDPSLPVPDSLVDFTQRCLARGLRHVIADDVLVGEVTGDGAPGLTEAIAQRYPYLRPWSDELARDSGSAAAMALNAARTEARRTSVTIDGRCLSASVTGTAVATLDLVDGLRTHTGLRVRVLVRDDLGQVIRDWLTGLGAELLLESDAASAEPTDVVHRPYQVGAPEDLTLLRRLGRRLVVTQLDSIAYRTPAYFDSATAWSDYRELTEAALASADAVVFLSPHGAADARSLGLVEEGHGTVIPLAVVSGSHRREDEPGDTAQRLPERPYLLCLGTDFAHKNRPFALRLLETLVASEGFDGGLVFAGPHVAQGSSAQEEAAYLATRPQIAERVSDVGAISEPEKRRLIANAAAVAYPTTFEGFGLIPFEAANLGVPTLFAWVTSLRDLFTEDLALLVPWDPAASARAVAPVLSPGAPRDRQIEGVLAAGASLTSSEYARRHAELYERALTRPETASRESAGERRS